MGISKTAGKRTVIRFWTALIFVALFFDTGHASQWSATYGGGGGDQINSIRQTSDGGSIAAGITYSFGKTAGDAWIVKLDADGTVQWQKTYGGTSYDEVAEIRELAGGGYIAVGTTKSYGAGGEDAWILKLASSGEIVGQKTYGGSDSDIIRSVHETGGGFIAAGTTNSYGSGAGDVWVLKLDSNLGVVWQKTYGGANDDDAFAVQGTDGGYIVAGVTRSFGAGDSDAWVLALDLNGNVEWERAYGGAKYDGAYSVQETSDGGFIVAGDTYSFSGSDTGDAWIMKLDIDGAVEWQKTYGGSLDDVTNYIQETSDGGFIAAGQTFPGDSDAWALLLGSDGNVIWEKVYGSSTDDWFYSIQETADDDGNADGYIVAGATALFNENFDAWVLKIDGDGNTGKADCSSIERAPLGASGKDTSSSPADTDSAVGGSTAAGGDTSVSPETGTEGAIQQDICNSAKTLLLLTVTVTSGGTVVSSETTPLIQCGTNGSDCTEIFNSAGKEVVLQAIPDADTGSVFSGWSGVNCSSKSTKCKVTMDGNRDVTASFGVQKFIIKSSSNKGGNIIPQGSLVAENKKEVIYGGKVVYVITPDPGYEIDHVKVDNDIIELETDSYTFYEVKSNHKIAVKFRLKSYVITASATAGGKITPSGSVLVKSGKGKTFTIKPGKNYKLVELKVDGESKELLKKFKFPGVEKNHTIEAVFAPKNSKNNKN